MERSAKVRRRNRRAGNLTAPPEGVAVTYPMAGQSESIAPRVGTAEISPEDVLRARFYALLAQLLMGPPTADTLATLRNLTGDDSEMGRALAALSTVAGATTPAAAADEFSALFIGRGDGGELLPYASHYLTGFLYEKPLAELRGDMADLGIARAPDSVEPEDHIGILCEIMHGLITGAFGAPADVEAQSFFFNAHVAPWASRFFEDMERAKAAALYMPVGTVGALFVAIERRAFEMDVSFKKGRTR